MQLYFLRHGEADWPGWTKSDDERPLTDFGKKEVRQVAKFLSRLNVKLDSIVTSPLPRALQTAEIAAEQLKTKLGQDEALEPGFGITELRTVLARHLSSFPKPVWRWSTSIATLRKADFSGCSRQKSRESVSSNAATASS